MPDISPKRIWIKGGNVPDWSVWPQDPPDWVPYVRSDLHDHVAAKRDALRAEKGVQTNPLTVPSDATLWHYYPIPMPLDAKGKGPATIGVDAVTMTYEVWDQRFENHGSFTSLHEAVSEAVRLNQAAVGR